VTVGSLVRIASQVMTSQAIDKAWEKSSKEPISMLRLPHYPASGGLQKIGDRPLTPQSPSSTGLAAGSFGRTVTAQTITPAEQPVRFSPAAWLTRLLDALLDLSLTFTERPNFERDSVRKTSEAHRYKGVLPSTDDLRTKRQSSFSREAGSLPVPSCPSGPGQLRLQSIDSLKLRPDPPKLVQTAYSDKPKRPQMLPPVVLPARHLPRPLGS
jgi:hypothetical protein